MDTWPSLYGGCRSVCPYLRHDGEPGPEVVQSHAARVHAVDQDLGGTTTIHTHERRERGSISEWSDMWLWWW